MLAVGCSLFDTALGACGIAWSERGVVSLLLPGRDRSATRARLERRWPGLAEAEPSEPVRHAIAQIVALLRSEPSDLPSIELDMTGVQAFEQRVYAAARCIPVGHTLTYGELARRVSQPGAARAVGQAMGRNPFAIIVPCHRVVAAGGRLGGFSAPGGRDTKQQMLAIERRSSSYQLQFTLEPDG